MEYPFDKASIASFADTSSWMYWAAVVLGFAVLLFLRYAILVGLFEWWFGQGSRRERYDKRRLRLSAKPRSEEQTRQELIYAASTSVIFGLSTAVLLWAWQSGYLLIYFDLQAYALVWLPLSLALAVLIHETYYYWLHRLMHHPKLYPWLHRGHHSSIQTSGWTSFAFDPGEAVLQAAIIPLILMLIPMHWVILVLWLMIMTLSAIVNHLGVELYPAGIYRHWLGRQLIGATHHGLHHTRFTRNYGLYFTFWDRWMGTEAEETLREFERYAGKGDR